MFALFYQHIDRQEEHDNVSYEHFEGKYNLVQVLRYSIKIYNNYSDRDSFTSFAMLAPR